MKKSLLIASILISTLLTAQTKVTVTVANFSFTSNSITINVGDTVEFVNASGTHWVDGRQATFPSNPASFDNQSQSGSGWTYTQVFTVAGAYDYRCGIHTGSMFGTITVQTPVGVKESVKGNNISFYPNPASKELSFVDYEKIKNVAIYSLTGEKVLETVLLAKKVDISILSPGVYFVKLTTDEGDITKKLIIQ